MSVGRPGRFLDRYPVVLFDLNGTLAVDYDRFGPGEDFHATYRALGGAALASVAVERYVRRGLEALMARYDVALTGPFPDMEHFLAEAGVPPGRERALLAEVVAAHEQGRIPTDRRGVLERLAMTHRLGLVSNLWGPAGHARAALEAAGVAGLFEVLVFSCEVGMVKPDPRLFALALEVLKTDPRQAVFVGDDPVRDIAGAAAAGMATVLVSPSGKHAAGPRPDRVITELEALEAL